MLTLYILGGCVGLAVVVFVIMSITSALRAPKLPDVGALEQVPLPMRFVRALTPRPAPSRPSQPALADRDSWSAMIDRARVPEAPRTVIPLPAIAGIAPATAAKRSDWVSAADTALAAAARGERAIIEDDWGNDITREAEKLPPAAAVIALPASKPLSRRAPAPSPLVMSSVASYATHDVSASAILSEEPAEDWAALRAAADAQVSVPSATPIARASAPALAWSPPSPVARPSAPPPALIVEDADVVDTDRDWDDSSEPGVAAFTQVEPPAAPRTRWPRATESQPAPTQAAPSQPASSQPAPAPTSAPASRKSATSWQLPADVALAPSTRPSSPAPAWTGTPIIRTDSDVETPQFVRTRQGLDRQSTFRVSRARARRHGLLWTLTGWLFATAMTAAAVAVVEPTLIDPLIEDYEWDGAPYAATARDYAWEARAALDMSDVTVTELERLPSPPAPPSL